MPAQVIETEMSDPARASALSRLAGLRSFAVPVTLLLIGAMMLALCWWARDLHRFTQWVTAYIWLFIGELAMCMLACGVVLKWNRHSSRLARLVTLAVILFFAIGLRATLVPQRPFLSTDAYRYVWDGHVQAHGVNPYRYAPDDPQVAPLRDPDRYPDAARIYQNVNWHDLPTPYPPVAQLIYLLVNWLNPLRVTAFKAAAMVFDTITILALMWALGRARMDPARAILFAWHPLPIWEGAHSGHIEAAFMMMLALALLAWTGRRHWLTGVLLALATAVKYYPALVLPAFLRADEAGDAALSRATNEQPAAPLGVRLMAAVRAVAVNRANLRMLAAFALTLVIVYLPYVWSGAAGFGALNNEFREEGFTGTGVRYFALDVIHKFVRLPASLFLIAAAALLAALGVWWATRTKTGVMVVARGAATLVGTYWLLTSPRYAWYYAWALPFLCFAPRLGWIYLTGASIFMYCLWYEPLVYPELPLWLGTAVYLPAIAWLIWENWRERRAASIVSGRGSQ
ncbi:MAG TPA: glycosyltransferase 87 family protein [Blastocatellia bacterium]|nr:glycosyltransferase 87 family protein [Blastocatellia bacterium]